MWHIKKLARTSSFKCPTNQLLQSSFMSPVQGRDFTSFIMERGSPEWKANETFARGGKCDLHYARGIDPSTTSFWTPPLVMMERVHRLTKASAPGCGSMAAPKPSAFLFFSASLVACTPRGPVEERPIARRSGEEMMGPKMMNIAIAVAKWDRME